MLTSGASGRVNALFSARAMKSLVAHLCAFLLMLLIPFRFRKRSAVSSVPWWPDRRAGRRGHQKVVRLPASALPLRAALSAVLDQEVATRRALAKKRVVQDEDEATTWKFALFTTARGDTLFTQTWTPVGCKIRGVVVLLHGLNEHSGRYSNFAKKLNANGFNVCGMDWIGHGGSDGLHAYVRSLDDMMISSPAPEDLPMSAAIRLGTMAKDLVKRFRIHGFSRRSKNPCITYWPAYVPVMVELCPDARRATAKSLELQLPTTFLNRKDALFKFRSWQLARSSGFRLLPS